MENHNGHTKWCTNRKHYDEMEDNRQLKLIKQTFEPYLAEYILKFNPVFDTELKFKKVLDELTSGMVVLKKQHLLECMYLIEEFPDYEDVEYEYVDRIPASLNQVEIWPVEFWEEYYISW